MPSLSKKGLQSRYTPAVQGFSETVHFSRMVKKAPARLRCSAFVCFHLDRRLKHKNHPMEWIV